MATFLGVALVAALSWPFTEHSIQRGMSMNSASEVAYSRLHTQGSTLANIAIYGHMIGGGLLTILAPLQLIQPIRKYFPWFHRALGYAIAFMAIAVAFGGLIYMAYRGTIGGLPMTFGFSLYGILVLVAALQTVRHARARSAQHWVWGCRLIVLALGSWLYRVHYAIWYSFAGGAYTRPDFSGAFDVVQALLFYVPYLLALEWWLWVRQSRQTAAKQDGKAHLKH